jgi:hypothetical protein
MQGAVRDKSDGRLHHGRDAAVRDERVLDEDPHGRRLQLSKYGADVRSPKSIRFVTDPTIDHLPRHLAPATLRSPNTLPSPPPHTHTHTQTELLGCLPDTVGFFNLGLALYLYAQGCGADMQKELRGMQLHVAPGIGFTCYFYW